LAAATAVAATPTTAAIRTGVGARVAAAAVVAVGRSGGRQGRAILGPGGCGGGVAVRRGEGLTGLGVGVVLSAQFFKDEERAGTWRR